LAGIRDFTTGTRLSDLQTTLMQFAVVALLLGVFNQAAAELRGQNRRITGLMPFWLVAFGVVGGGAGLAAAGVAQVYLERLLSVGYLETQTLLIPLYTLWFIGLILLAFGVLIYALGFWARRPMRR
jgi:nitric oxide reductase subunit B